MYRAMTANEFADSFEMWAYLAVALLLFVLLCLSFYLALKVLHWFIKQIRSNS